VLKKLLSYLLALGLHLVELGVENSQISLVALNLSQVGLVLFKVAFDFLLNFGLLRLGLPQLLMQVLHLELVQLCSRFRLLLKYAVKVLLILREPLRLYFLMALVFQLLRDFAQVCLHLVDQAAQLIEFVLEAN
jgi:uncharacterized SAM-dependent methyltransferase